MSWYANGITYGIYYEVELVAKLSCVTYKTILVLNTLLSVQTPEFGKSLKLLTKGFSNCKTCINKVFVNIFMKYYGLFENLIILFYDIKLNCILLYKIWS